MNPMTSIASVILIMALGVTGFRWLGRLKYGKAPMMEKVDMLKYQPRYFSELRQNNRDLTAKLSEIKARPERTRENALEFRRIQDERMENTKEVVRAAKVNLIQIAAAGNLGQVKDLIEKFTFWQIQLINHRHGQTYDFYNEMWSLVSFHSWNDLVSRVPANKLWFLHQHMDDPSEVKHLVGDHLAQDLAEQMDMGEVAVR